LLLLRRRLLLLLQLAVILLNSCLPGFPLLDCCQPLAQQFLPALLMQQQLLLLLMLRRCRILYCYCLRGARSSSSRCCSRKATCDRLQVRRADRCLLLLAALVALFHLLQLLRNPLRVLTAFDCHLIFTQLLLQAP
jgi:hypothetical protein